MSKGRITSVLLDPSRTQIRFTVKCDDQKVIQTTREFLKFDHDVDVSKIPQTTDDYTKECSRIDPEQLQHLMHPKALNEKQEECLRWHERLDHMPYAQMRTLCELGVLPKKFLSYMHYPCAHHVPSEEPKEKLGVLKMAMGLLGNRTKLCRVA